MEDIAVDALRELGLSTYEARVFTALVQLNSGTASDVASVSDVPRSQVYTTVDDLKSRGLISIQQSNPKVFLPVSLAEAQAQLERRFEGRLDTAFDHLTSLEQTSDNGNNQNEDVWSITGTAAVTERIDQLASDAEQTVLYAAEDLNDPDPNLLTTFAALCDRGVELMLVADYGQPVGDIWDTLSVPVARLPEDDPGNEYAERVLIVDSDIFLLSIRGGETQDEIAVWSAHTTFSQVFSQLILESIPVIESSAFDSK